VDAELDAVDTGATGSPSFAANWFLVAKCLALMKMPKRAGRIGYFLKALSTFKH